MNGRRGLAWARVLATLALLPVWGAGLGAQSDVDVFMEKVLERREENRATLRSYVLDEVESFEVVGPGRLPLQSFRHEYTWYARDGYLVRSPVRLNGVSVGESARREYEETWLRQERRRDVNRQRQPRGWSRRSTFDNVTRSVERLWGRRINDRLTRQIAEDARLWRDDMAAIVVAADRILDDLGGVDDVGFDRVMDRARDAFTMLESDRLDRLEVAAVVGGLVRQLADALDDATSDEIARFVELAELAARFELPMSELGDALSDSVARVRKRGMTTQADTIVAARARLPAATESRADAPDVVAGAASGGQVQPRFVSESYFLDFPFEPGNYFFSGREMFAGRDVVKIEYYPEQLFAENSPVPDTPRDEEVTSGFDKTSLVTLWVEPNEFQIVKFTFDNVGFEFLPLRWLVRLDDLKASMVMGQPIDGVWLPDAIELTGKLSMATGSFTLRYARTFSGYRQAEVSTTIRSYGPVR